MDLGENYPDFDSPEFDGLITALEDNKVTTQHIIILSAQELATRCNRSLNEVSRFRREFLHHAINVDKLPSLHRGPEIREHELFTTGDAGLDEMLNGGIRTKCLTEFVGEAGSGKSHILTKLAFTVQQDVEDGGLGRAAIIVSTEPSLPKVRLKDFERATSGSLDAIIVYKCSTYQELQSCLMVNVPRAVQQFDVGLVIIDSIAQPFRGMPLRTIRKLIEPPVDSLRWHSINLNFAIVLSNQVMSLFRTEIPADVDKNVLQYDYQSRWHSGWTTNTVTWLSEPFEAGASQYQYQEPALRPYCGGEWSLAVDVRVAVKRDRMRVRHLDLVYSPWARPQSREFEIRTEGVVVGGAV